MQLSDFIFKTTTNQQRIDRYVEECLQRKVHAFGGLKDAFEDKDVKCMSVCLKDNQIIGCAAITHHLMYSRYSFGVYVKPDFRRLGIGSKLTRLVRKRCSDELFVDYCANEQFFDNFNFVKEV